MLLCVDYAGGLLVNAGENAVLLSCLVPCPFFRAVILLVLRLVLTLTPGEERDDEDKVGSRPGISEVAEYRGIRKGKQSLDHIVEVAGDTP